MGAGTPARPHGAADRKGAYGGRDVVALGVAPRAREDRDLRCSAQPEAASQGIATPAFLSRDGQGSRRSRVSSARIRYAGPCAGRALMNTARKGWMTLETLDTEMPLTGDFAQPPLPALTGAVRCRSIYAASAMDDPAARRIIEACTEAGEQARLLPTVPMKMKLADHTTAMLPLTPTGTAGALVVRAPVIIAALREYFELLWERATPLKASRSAAPGDRLTPAQQAVLELMAEGLHDDAIAHRAGISTTTVRRHITAIIDRLGVRSRFAAGAAAQRRGWIG